jgi:hypothetical protein
MQRGSDKHGSWQDDLLSKETEDGAVVGGAGYRAGAPDGMTPQDLDDRAALGALLGKDAWPALGETVQRRVSDSLGPDKLRDLVARLHKNKAYASLAEAWAEITGEPLERRF